MARMEEASRNKKDGLLQDWAISSVRRRKRAWPRAGRTLGCQAEYKGREEFSFFSKFPKQIFKWILNFSIVFESNHSIQKSNAAA
jgi:hypothetical protein